LYEGGKDRTQILLADASFCPSPELLFSRGKCFCHCVDALRVEEHARLIIFGSLSYIVLKHLVVDQQFLVFPILDFGGYRDLPHQFIGELYGEVVT
jgi:hypothetical protein